LSKNKSTPKGSSKKPTAAPSATKFTPAQKKRLQKTLAKMPSIEKLDPAVYAKLQSSIRDAVAKTLPEYQKWVNSSLTAADDCPTQQCSSCGNDCPTQLCSACSNQCPTPVKGVDDIVVNAVNEAMMGAIRQALKEQFK
jgi:formylmethanofuran:tetrahydromethanopterin formyltransferase